MIDYIRDNPRRLGIKREQLPSGKWRLCRDKAGRLITGTTSEEFEKKARKALAAAAHGKRRDVVPRRYALQALKPSAYSAPHW